MNYFKKLFNYLICSAIIIGLTLLGLQAYFLWQNSETNKTRLEIKHSGSLEERKQRQKDKEDRQKQKEQLEIDALKGFNAQGKGKILDIDRMDPPLGIKGLATQGAGDLVFSAEIKNHFTAILEDVEDLINAEMVYTHKDEYDDNSSGKFTRRNTILYGAPGTGKSEFARQLVFEIADKHQSPNERKIKEYSEELLKKQEQFVNNSENEQLKTEISELKELIKDCEQQLAQEESKIVPVFQIDGFHLQTAGKAIDSKGLESHEKLIAILKELKKEAFGDPYSDKPYIAFVEEADQGVNVLTAGSGGKKNNLLEDWKNFLSTTEDKAGLANKVQDPNSCLIIATNNYETLDPALVRRGRLGKKLNFSWTPAILKEYGETGGQSRKDEDGNPKINWKKINWPDNEDWKFEGNNDDSELYKMTTKFGFASFCKEFAPHANKIIQSYQALSEEQKKQIEAKLGTFKDDSDKEVCNWLLHYLYTFHKFNHKQRLGEFKGAEQIERYEFGHHKEMEDRTREIANFVSNAIINMGRELKGALSDIRAEIHSNFEEVFALRQDINNFRDKINELDREIDRTKELIKQTSQNISSMVSSQISSQLSGLQSQINSVSSRISSINSSGGGSSNSQATSKYNNLNSGASSLINRLRDYINSGSTDLGRLRQIINDFVDVYNDN